MLAFAAVVLAGAATKATNCTGSSEWGLPAEQCQAWIDFYDATGGPGWRSCSELRTDPCACKEDLGHVLTPICNDAGSMIVTM